MSQAHSVTAAAGIVILAAVLGVAGSVAAEGGGTRAVTDAYAVIAPQRPWARLPGLEPAGRLSWSLGHPGVAQALVRVDYEGVSTADRDAAYATLLRRARARIRETLDGRNDVDRGDFEPDSMIIAGGLAWRGFRVAVRATGFVATSWRWYALHPDFPRRRTAFLITYEETTPPRATALDRADDARALARSLVPQGKGLAGDLSAAWLDARALAFAARIDSAQKLCWSVRPDGLRGTLALGYGVMASDGGDFFQVTGAVPRDSLADPSPAEYGVAFDRNHDGSPDLLILNRGVLPFDGNARQPTVAVLADDDFDGAIDGAVVEDVDGDGDTRVDARLRVHESGMARTFTDAMQDNGVNLGSRVFMAKGTATIRRLGYPSDRSDFSEVFNAAGPRLRELAAARARCVTP